MTGIDLARFRGARLSAKDDPGEACPDDCIYRWLSLGSDERYGDVRHEVARRRSARSTQVGGNDESDRAVRGIRRLKLGRKRRRRCVGPEHPGESKSSLGGDGYKVAEAVGSVHEHARRPGPDRDL
ncbi:MAG TPA: hypothetical protein VG368_07095 [Acidimicrobiales bacterium]|nr:hypothetical protein [Acidimicrobiales bacterium]